MCPDLLGLVKKDLPNKEKVPGASVFFGDLLVKFDFRFSFINFRFPKDFKFMAELLMTIKSIFLKLETYSFEISAPFI